jgi:TonB family protein
MTWYECLADASVRAVALAAMAGVLVLFLRGRSAAQHAIWTVVTIGMLTLPVLRLTVPAAYVYKVARPAPAATIALPPAQLADHAGGTSASNQAARIRPAPIRLPVYAGIAYVAGVALFGLRLLAGLWMTRRLLRGARPVDLGVEESDRVRVPVTIGLKRMRVILPSDWREWPAEKTRVVLAHELAHARRYNPAIGLLAAVNKCVFWFHPLAWWLEHRLAVLAEHAADDAGLAVSADPASYARVLLEVAARIEGQTTRLIWNASAMNGQLVARRIRRVMDSRTKPGTGRLGGVSRAALVSGAALLIWISVAVDLQSVVRAQVKPATEDAEATWWLGFRTDGPQPGTTTAEQAAQMEQQLAANPEDEATRTKLLRYYWRNDMRDRRIPLVLWLIDHHPESALHGYGIAAIFPAKDDPGSVEEARHRWLAQVDRHPDDARVLANAARAMGGDGNVSEEVELMKRARSLDPAHGTEPLAMLYSIMLVSTNAMTPQIRSELQASNDAVLVGKVARHFVDRATGDAILHGDRDFTALRAIATELVAHAQALDPQNRDWADLMEGVKGLPIAPAQTAAASPAQTVRIGAGIAAGMLLQSSPPVYPPLAKMARIQGVVKLQVHIGEDGHVTAMTVVSGHPLLVPAAMDAVKRYVYKPVTMQGKALEAITTVDVAFQ